jgi:gas vesicle protein
MKKVLFLALALISAPVFAGEPRQVPTLMNYQGSLTDEGGNPLPDGETTVMFRVLDPGGAILFEERQDVEVVEGRVSAVIGNGIDSSTGGLSAGVPTEALDPKGLRYLQVEVSGHEPYQEMLITSSPYAVFAGTALGVAVGGVASNMIADGAIKKEHLSDELTGAIFPTGISRELLPADTVFKDEFDGFRNDIQGAGGAARVGVASSFVYSGAQTVEGVLKDIDTAVKKRQEEINFVNANGINRAGDVLNGEFQFSGQVSVANLTATNLTATKLWGELAGTSGTHSGTWQGYNPGNASGNIPVNNGTVSAGLNADLIDGYHYDNIPSYMRAPLIVKKGFVVVKYRGGWCTYADSDGANGTCGSSSSATPFDVVQVIRSKATAFDGGEVVYTEDEPHILHVGSNAAFKMLPVPDYDSQPPISIGYSISGPQVRIVKDSPGDPGVKTGRLDTIIRIKFEREATPNMRDTDFLVEYTVYGLDM